MKATKITAVVVIILVAIYLFGSNFIWKSYVNEEFGFSILLPRLWTQQEGAFGAAVMATSPRMDSSDKFQENISVLISRAPVKMKLATFYQINKSDVLETLPGDELDIEEGEIVVGGNRGMWLALSSQGKNMILRTISVLFMKQDRVYIVTCTARDSEYLTYEPVFKKALGSFRIK